MDRKTVAQYLRGAREALLSMGWIKGSARTEHGVCARGAVAVSVLGVDGVPCGATHGFTLDWGLRTVWERVCRALDEGKPPEFKHVADFNDAGTTAVGDVVAMFDRAIVLAEAKEAAAASVTVEREVAHV